MTNSNNCTYWPLNMPLHFLSRHDGEQALANSELAAVHDLSLLYGVKRADLTAADGTNRQADISGGRFDYLVCKADAVLLAIELMDKEAWCECSAQADGLPTAKIPLGQFCAGQVADIIEQLNRILSENKPPLWRCFLQPCPDELTEELLSQVLTERQSNGDIVPTEYGTACGLVRVVQRHCAAMCSARTAQRLPALLHRAALQNAQEKDRVPFEELLQTCRAGLRRNGHSSAKLVKMVMDMPLDQYMDGFPNELERLRSGLVRRCTTYGEAACIIYSMLHAFNDAWRQTGVELMRLLAIPPIEDEKIVQGIQMGRRVIGRMPDYMPLRYCKSKASGTESGQTFQERVSRVSGKLPASVKLTSGTQESFFHGVGILARSGYPQWCSKAIKDYLEIQGRSSYVGLLNMAEHNFEQEDDWYHDIGIRLYYLLLIEPFYLIFQRNQQD